MGSWVFYAAQEKNGVFNAGLRFVTYDIGATAARQTSLDDTVTGLVGPISGNNNRNLEVINNSNVYYLGSAQSIVNGTTFYRNWTYKYPLGSLQKVPYSIRTASFTSPSYGQTVSPDTVFYFGGNTFLIDGVNSAVNFRYLRRVTATGNTVVGALIDLIGAELFTSLIVGTTAVYLVKEISTSGAGTITATITYYSSTNGFIWTGPHTRTLDVTGGYGTPWGIVTNNSDRWVLIFTNGNVNAIYSSADSGLNWVPISNLPAGLTYVNPAIGFRVWCLGSRIIFERDNVIYQTTDGTAWTTATPFPGSNVNDIALDGSTTYMVVGSDGQAVTTTNFSTFTPFTGFDFEYQDIYEVLYTTQVGNLIGYDNAILSVTNRNDAAVIRGGVNSATGVIQGTLRLDTSDGAFAARDVYLYSYTTGAKIAETTSDGITGAWEFTQVAPGEYFVVGVAQGDDLSVPRDFDALGVITVV